MSNQVTIKGITGALGATVEGIDLSEPLSAANKATIDQALLDYNVLAFPNQDISPPALASLGKQFGQLHDEPFIPSLEGHPGVFRMTGSASGRKAVAELNWHVDHSYIEMPTMGAMLYAQSVPAVGGDTVFSSMYKAYDALSPAMKDIADQLHVIHDVLHYGLQSGHMSTETTEQIERLSLLREHFPRVEHPLVCTHPDTGKKFLYVNDAWAHRIVGMTEKESRPLLNFFNQHSIEIRFQCRIRWANGTLVFWDNRCVQHSPTPDHAESREMIRVAIGDTSRPS